MSELTESTEVEFGERISEMDDMELFQLQSAIEEEQRKRAKEARTSDSRVVTAD